MYQLMLIFSPHCRGEFLVLDSDSIIIGAAPGNVAEAVILERDTESTVMFVEGNTSSSKNFGSW